MPNSVVEVVMPRELCKTCKLNDEMEEAGETEIAPCPLHDAQEDRMKHWKKSATGTRLAVERKDHMFQIRIGEALFQRASVAKALEGIRSVAELARVGLEKEVKAIENREKRRIAAVRRELRKKRKS